MARVSQGGLRLGFGLGLGLGLGLGTRGKDSPD